MSKRFRECSLDQDYLLPPSLHDWLPENHLARFIAEVSEQLDLGQVHASYQTGDGRGLAAYHPLLMVRLLLYGYCVGRRSSRQIEKATHEDVAFRYLAGNQHPDHDTIAAFRRRHAEALGNLFGQVLELCRAAGLVKVGTIAIDGTKMKANASREQTVRYGQLEDREERLQQRVREILEEAERADAEEDARYGRGRKEPDLPPELATVEGRLQKIREAKQRLEQEAAERTPASRNRSANKLAATIATAPARSAINVANGTSAKPIRRSTSPIRIPRSCAIRVWVRMCRATTRRPGWMRKRK